MCETQRQLPKYKCHKEVWALKIKSIDLNKNEVYYLVPEDERYAPFEVDSGYVDRHNPQPGGYYVVYEDGYRSFSSAQAFEEGYSLVT